MVRVYKPIHKKPRILHSQLRELHRDGHSHHYIPTSRARPQIEGWLKTAHPKLFDKIMAMIYLNEAYPVTHMTYIRPTLRDQKFHLSYGHSQIQIDAPASLLKTVHSVINNSAHLVYLQLICCLRAFMAADRADQFDRKYFHLDGTFFTDHPDIHELLLESRIGHQMSISFEPVDSSMRLVDKK